MDTTPLLHETFAPRPEDVSRVAALLLHIEARDGVGEVAVLESTKPNPEVGTRFLFGLADIALFALRQLFPDDGERTNYLRTVLMTAETEKGDDA